MPQYDFIRDGELTSVFAPMSRIAAITEEMAREGWRRIYTPPAIQVYPVTWQEALEWAIADTDRAEREWAERSDKLFKEALSQVPKADLEGFLNGEEVEI